MSDLSSRIIRAEVSTIDSYLKDGKIYSKVILDVDQTYTGIDESEIEIHMLGGTYNDLQMQVSGLPVLHEGEKTLLFLNHENILGFGQGIFTFSGTEVSRFPNVGLPPQDFNLASLPDEREAKSCLAPIIDAHYSKGWNLKHLYTHHSLSSKNNIFPFGTYEGLEYKIIVCTDGKPDGSILQITDAQGNIIKEQNSLDQEKNISFIASQNGLHQLQFGIGNFKEYGISSGLAIGILYRE